MHQKCDTLLHFSMFSYIKSQTCDELLSKAILILHACNATQVFEVLFSLLWIIEVICHNECEIVEMAELLAEVVDAQISLMHHHIIEKHYSTPNA